MCQIISVTGCQTTISMCQFYDTNKEYVSVLCHCFFLETVTQPPLVCKYKDHKTGIIKLLFYYNFLML